MAKEAKEAKEVVETHWQAICSGKDGTVPEGKEPGRDILAVRHADGTADVNCDNFAPDSKKCAINEARCVFTRTPTHQFTDHTLSHIEHTPDASRTSLTEILGVSPNTAGRVVDRLIDQGIIEEIGLLPRTAKQVGQPGIGLRIKKGPGK